MKYSLFLCSFPSTFSLFFLSLHPSVSGMIFTSGCLISSKDRWKACVCGQRWGITRIPLDSGVPPSDASHLRHGRRRPSKPSARLPLIDLSLDGGVSWFFRDNLTAVLERVPSFFFFLRVEPGVQDTASSGGISLHRYAFTGTSICIWKPGLFCSCFREHEALLCRSCCPPVASQALFSLEGLEGGGGWWSPCLFKRAGFCFKSSFLYSEVKCLKHLNQEWVLFLTFLTNIMMLNLLCTYVRNIYQIYISGKAMINSGSEEFFFIFLNGYKPQVE